MALEIKLLPTLGSAILGLDDSHLAGALACPMRGG